MQEAELYLSLPQIKKLAKGKPCQCSSPIVGGASKQGEKVVLMLKSPMYKKLSKARRLGKGCRLQLSPDEIEASGLRDWLKKASKFYKEHIKPTAAPLIRKGVQRAVDYGLSAAKVAAPWASDAIERVEEKYADPAIDWLGRRTGAYGYAPCHCGGSGVMPVEGWSIRDARAMSRAGIPRDVYPGFGEYQDTMTGRGGSFRVQGSGGHGFRAF